MNGLRNHLKKSDPKTRKTVKIGACEQKTTSEKSNKNFHAAKSLAFSLPFLSPRDQNHYSNLTSKIMKMCEQILKNQKKANNSHRYRYAAVILYIQKKTMF